MNHLSSFIMKPTPLFTIWPNVYLFKSVFTIRNCVIPAKAGIWAETNHSFDPSIQSSEPLSTNSEPLGESSEPLGKEIQGLEWPMLISVDSLSESERKRIKFITMPFVIPIGAPHAL